MMGQPLPSTARTDRQRQQRRARTDDGGSRDTRRDALYSLRQLRQRLSLWPGTAGNGAHARAGDLEGAVEFGLMDCIACGSCAYVCPSHIPLVQYFNYAKGELTARQRANTSRRKPGAWPKRAASAWKHRNRPNVKPWQNAKQRWPRKRPSRQKATAEAEA